MLMLQVLTPEFWSANTQAVRKQANIQVGVGCVVQSLGGISQLAPCAQHQHCCSRTTTPHRNSTCPVECAEQGVLLFT